MGKNIVLAQEKLQDNITACICRDKEDKNYYIRYSYYGRFLDLSHKLEVPEYESFMNIPAINRFLITAGVFGHLITFDSAVAVIIFHKSAYSTKDIDKHLKEEYDIDIYPVNIRGMVNGVYVDTSAAVVYYGDEHSYYFVQNGAGCHKIKDISPEIYSIVENKSECMTADFFVNKLQLERKANEYFDRCF